MPVELRKRKAPAPPPAPPPAKKAASTKAAKAATKVKEVVETKVKAAVAKTNGAAATKAAKPGKGDTITLDGFGGEIQTNDGTKTTLKALVDESKAGVVLFTYPKASTPGCKLSSVLLMAKHRAIPFLPCLPPSSEAGRSQL